MHSIFRQLHGFHRPSFSYYSRLVDHCFLLKSLNFVKIVHAQLIKVGFNSHTFLGNRCLDAYFRFGNTVSDALGVFDDIFDKNVVSGNILLKGLCQFEEIQGARNVFVEMPVRDVVSWNSMISGYLSSGSIEKALELFSQMKIAGVRPSEYTFSIMMTLVRSASHGKQIHCGMIRSGMNFSNVVLGNSLIDMYGKLSCVDYALSVFFTMEEVDIISWNSLISGCHRSGYDKLALEQFFQMRTTDLSPDEFTISTIINVCCNLPDLEKGKQIVAFCFKMGYFSNSIVSSAAIDLFSKCNRLENAVRLFEELDQWSSAVCNSMISSYARHGRREDSVRLFVLSLKENLRPTAFTLSSLLNSASIFLPAEPGSQIHSLVVKLGFESDTIVASSLVDLYSKVGLINYSMKVFANMGVKDLRSWNTTIMGLAHNGKVFETLNVFEELVSGGIAPDNLTLNGVLLACNLGSFVDEGTTVLLSMEKEYGIIPREEHYTSVVDMLSRAGKLKEAMDMVAAMPYEPSSMIWESILHACVIHGDFTLTERVSRRMMKSEPQSSLPYLVLARAYEMRGRWESMVRVRKAMKLEGVRNVMGFSSIGIQNHVFTFKEDQLQPHRGKDIYSILRLLAWELEAEDYIDNLTK